uniref:Uncharacterized protein n=1 Tax=Gopherus agassizii TaxID=38772 RepID=A0A452HQQ4_9SAUR
YRSKRGPSLLTHDSLFCLRAFDVGPYQRLSESPSTLYQLDHPCPHLCCNCCFVLFYCILTKKGPQIKINVKPVHINPNLWVSMVQSNIFQVLKSFKLLIIMGSIVAREVQPFG